MKESFLKKDRPTIVGMLRAKTTKELLREIDLILTQGVDAFGLQIERMPPEEKTAENYKKIFSAMQGKPAYVTNYIRGNALNLSDEALTEELLTTVDCGAKLIDIRCDLFDRQPDEYSTDKKAIEKQIELIKTIKAMGAEVLMSAHVLKYIPCERVLEIALSQQERGADIVKIVTEANSETELMDNIKTSIILTEQLSVPALFLCNGTHCKKHRILGPVLNNSPFLVVENSYEGQNQPTIQRAREQLILSGYTNLP